MNQASRAGIDHLVVAAPSLAEGVAWCEATLGLTPGPGGAHALFGTHNRLLRLHSTVHPKAYLEIIAIDPAATPTRPPPLRRWFDLDDPALRERLRREGPQLIHWVASVPDIDAACARLRALGIERGPVIDASRPTPQGLLRWRITVRDDGQRLFGGALPTLIQWGDTHPADGMTGADLGLQGLTLQHPDAGRLTAALTAIGLDGVAVHTGPAGLRADLTTADGQPLVLNPSTPA
ncbi:VOC family protein [Hydrogenophaga pseudoflava]|uniref:VOC family protein n=1 Tax=Hydrogenophaga pseudoflava TaxID=47421 RepID=UPI000824CAB0|nr:VOC family protein [Hydrogenophaga pseudoflava]